MDCLKPHIYLNYPNKGSTKPSIKLNNLLVLILLINSALSIQSQPQNNNFLLHPHHQAPNRHLSASAISYTGDTLVNTYTTDDEKHVAIGNLINGGFVFVWMSASQYASQKNIFAQIYDSTGAPSGSEFGISNNNNYDRDYPSACGLTNGNFVVAYQGDSSANWCVYFKIYSSTGSSVVGVTQMNQYTSGDTTQVSVSCLANGGFVAAWMSDGQDGDGLGMYSRIYHADGTVVGNEFRVNTQTSDDQSYGTVASFTDSSFVVAWIENHSGDDDVKARLFSSSGTATTGEFVVNTYTTDDQKGVAAAVFSDGTFIIAWQSKNQNSHPWTIYYQVFTSAGAKSGSPTQVNTYTSNGQTNPAISVLTNDNFLITWVSSGQDGDSDGVYAQKYLSTKATEGSEFRVNIQTTDKQNAPFATKFQNSNGYLIAWQSNNQDGDGYGVYASIYLDCASNQVVSSCSTGCSTGYYAWTANYRCQGK